MASKVTFQINTPRGSLSTLQSSNGKTSCKLTWNDNFGKEKSDSFGKGQQFIDSECLRLMNPLTPRKSGTLIKSGTLGTVIGSGKIEYVCPYARRQYYENKGGEGQRGKQWFERMKAANKDELIKGAQRIVGK